MSDAERVYRIPESGFEIVDERGRDRVDNSHDLSAAYRAGWVDALVALQTWAEATEDAAIVDPE